MIPDANRLRDGAPRASTLNLAGSNPAGVAKHACERHDDRDRQMAVLADLLRAKTADGWETFLQQNHVPASRKRALPEALADPQLATRGFLHTNRRHSGRSGLCQPELRLGPIHKQVSHSCQRSRGIC
jgi:crotonobetainyl-CoA:carnitine CoA-transferase CaiB-like acyl-CoA transferase